MWNNIVLKLKQKNNETAVLLSAWKSRPCYIAIRFEKEISAEWRILGDEWERTYGDMAWQPMSPHKRLPWYFLITKDHRTCGVGVKIRPGAMCFWQIDETGITLFLDVRCGGKGVSLSGRAFGIQRYTIVSFRKAGASLSRYRRGIKIIYENRIHTS